MEILNEKNYWVYSGSSYLVEFILPGWMINSIAQSGDNTPAVKMYATSDAVQNGLKRYSDEDIRKTYDEVCYEDNNPNADRQEMIEYLLWDACWNAVDDDELKEGELL